MLRLIGVGLALVSAATTAHFLFGFVISAGVIAASVAAAAGVLLECSKYAIYPSVFRSGGGSMAWRIPAGALAICMTIATITCSYLFLDRAMGTGVSRGQVEVIRGELRALDAQITSMQSGVDALVRLDRVSKASPMLSDISIKRAERTAVADRLAAAERAEVPALVAQWGWLIFACLATLVDLGAIICLCSPAKSSTNSTPEIITGNVSDVILTASENFTKSPENQGQKPSGNVSSSDILRLRTEILAGNLEPKAAKVRERFRCRHDRAVAMLGELVEEGVLLEVGDKQKRYVRA